jgi:hypothetical protein
VRIGAGAHRVGAKHNTDGAHISLALSEPSVFYIAVKCLPQMPDEITRRYLFVAIDLATCWVLVEIYPGESESSSTDFLGPVKRQAGSRSPNCLPTTPLNLSTASPARKKNSAASIYLTDFENNSRLSIDSFHHTIGTAGYSPTTASARSSTKLDSVLLLYEN